MFRTSDNRGRMWLSFTYASASRLCGSTEERWSRPRLAATDNVGNWQIIAVSEGYKAKKSALNGIDSIRRNAPDAEISEELE